MGRSPKRGRKESQVREIAAMVVRLAVGMEPPRRARLLALYPGVHNDTLNEGYRVGCLDLVLTPGGKPLTGRTEEERDLIKDRAARLWAWKLAHPSCSIPARGARPVTLPGGRTGSTA